MASPLVPSDLLRIVIPAEPQLAPGGDVIFYRRSWFDADEDAIRGAIRRVDAEGHDRAFTSGTNDRLPRVAPGGSALAYVTERDKKAQLAVLRLDGGEAERLGEPYAKITALAWSPDATRLAFVATAPHDPQTAASFLDEKSGARHIRRLPFKSDQDGLLDGARRHLFIAGVSDGTIRQLTSGDFDCGPPSWSPDGTRVAFAARIEESESATALADICVVDVASGKLSRLTGGSGPMQLPVFSHDGREIAFIGHHHGDDGGGQFDDELLVMAADGGATRSLSAGIGRTVTDHLAGDLRSSAPAPPVWSAGDREIFIAVCDEGATVVRAFARDGSATRTVAGGERHVYGFSFDAASGALALAYSTPAAPGEIAIVEPYGAERTLTNANPWLAEKDVVTPVRFRPRAHDGTRLDAWLLPARGREARPPLVLEVHGGPHGAYGFTFFLEFQILAGAGIAVAFGNPRGSQSYGAAYAGAILGDWGGLDVDDVLAILDGALEQGTFDTARVGVAGGSYGGFMATWLAGHSNRFAAAVSMRAVNDFVSEIGASDLGWFLERELQTSYAEDAGRKLFESSPMRAAASIDLPLLVEHSERDYRCPIDQGEQLFTALRRLGKNCEFVRFADTGHEMSRNGKPRSRVLRYRAIANWFVRHLRPAGASAPPDVAGGVFAPLAGESELR